MGTVAVLLPFAAALCAVNAAAMPRAVVLASHAGWNATNATAAVQSTIDSGADVVVIDKTDGDWLVGPIFLRRSNQEIVVADGVAVRALPGAFHRRNDCLFTIPAGVSNVVLRGEGNAVLSMRKREYQNLREYSFSEWRHCVSIVGGCGIAVSNLTMLASGGDGVYVRGAAKDVRLDRLICRDHHRQAISIISTENLLVTNCRFESTTGTAPQCGLDIEPNTPKDRVENVVFEDCSFDGNAATGIMLHLLQLNNTSRPVSVLFRRCTSRCNGLKGIRINCAKEPHLAVRGKIAFEDCSVSGNRQSALSITRKCADAIDISFRNCEFDATASEVEAVQFDNASLLADFGGVAFDGVRIKTEKEKAFSFNSAGGTGVAPGTVSGKVTVERADGSRETLDVAELSKSYPPNPAALRALLAFKTEPPDYGKWMELAKRAPRPPSPTGWLRKRFTYVQMIPGAGDWPIVFRMRKIGRRSQVVKAKVQVLDAAGTDLGSFELGEGVSTNIIHATGSGLRRFEVNAVSGVCSVVPVIPGGGLQADGYVHLFGGKRRYFFFVPAEADKVGIQVRPEEPCSARLLRPDGTVAAEMPYGRNLTVLETKREPSVDETWCIDIPSAQEDVEFRIGVPAIPVATP